MFNVHSDSYAKFQPDRLRDSFPAACHRNSDADGDSNIYPYPNIYAYPDDYPQPDQHSNADCHPYSNQHADANATPASYPHPDIGSASNRPISAKGLRSLRCCVH